jgi:FkbM family methyltransferase
MATNETSYVTKTLFWNGPENFEYTPIFEKLIQKCTTFIDIGANTGYYSLVAAKLNRAIKVHAFEPSPGPAYFLQKNISINKFQNSIEHHPIALSNHSGKIDFFEIRTPERKEIKHNLSGVGTTKKIFDTQENSVINKVNADTLDNVAKVFNEKSIDLIKIDTEGTENFILLGASETILKHKPIIICETLFQQIEDQIESIMRTHGYLFYNHLNRKLIKTETLKREFDNGVRDCFLVHPDKVELINEFISF